MFVRVYLAVPDLHTFLLDVHRVVHIQKGLENLGLGLGLGDGPRLTCHTDLDAQKVRSMSSTQMPAVSD